MNLVEGSKTMAHLCLSSITHINYIEWRKIICFKWSEYTFKPQTVHMWDDGKVKLEIWDMQFMLNLYVEKQ